MLEGYFKGMLMISVEGSNLERFINRCNAKGITLYNVARQRYDMMLCSIDLDNFKTVAAVNRELKCRIRVKRRYGLKFLLNRLSRRKAFVVGAAMFVIFLTVLSSSIWRIDVSGADRLQVTQILKVLEDNGAGVGVFKTRCDTKALELAIKKELDDVEWVIVELKGVVMDVRVIESVEAIPREDTAPASLVAEVEAEILKINPLRGDPMVKVGDIVSPGQVLLNGLFDRMAEENYYKLENASGLVRARVRYSGTASICLDDIDHRFFTGRERTVCTVKLFGVELGQKSSVEFENYTVETEEYKLFSRGALFPIYGYRRVYKEYRPLTAEEIYSLGQEKILTMAYNDANRLIPIEAETETQSTEYIYNEVTRVLTANTTVTVIHNIGVKRLFTDEEIAAIEQKYQGKKEQQ